MRTRILYAYGSFLSGNRFSRRNLGIVRKSQPRPAGRRHLNVQPVPPHGTPPESTREGPAIRPRPTAYPRQTYALAEYDGDDSGKVIQRASWCISGKRYYEGYSGIVRVVLLGLLGRPGAGTCPHLPQRRPGPGSVVNETAEYQRFFSRVPARSGPLWQIWTTGAAAGPVGRASPASARSMTSAPARTPARRAVVDRADAPFDRAGPARAPPRGRLRRPDPRDRHLTAENVC